ncbi:MAG: LLM class F420-dependent oxidoreductase [Acidimicrobiales bacterium]|nr:LLM class F420-dependent oxidoreductase [Acidimicrobiales bacterium]
MPHERRFRFGVQLATAPDRESWAALARKAEALGYSSLFVPDHFGDQLAPGPALMAAADATTDLRVGALVWDNDYRHPVVLAMEAATIDLLSGGRLELGLGAGWMRTDYEQSGIAYDPPAVRVDRFEESIAVLKGLFAEGPFSHRGPHYTITGLDLRPRPVQRPHPPLLIGGGGRRVLSIAARHADIVGVNPRLHAGEIGPDALADATADAVDRKVGWVREAAGDRFDDLELNVLAFVAIVTDDPGPMAELVAGGMGLDPADVQGTPHVLLGSVEQIAETLHARRERWGFSYVVVQGDAMDGFAPVVARLAGT